MQRISRQVPKRPWLSALLLVAFSCRALVPVGYMPGAGGLILCPGYAPVAAQSGQQHSLMGHDHAHSHNHAHSHSNDGNGYCPFGGVTSPLLSAHVLPMLAPAAPLATVISYPPQQALPRGTIVPTRLPRGPPANV
jgi:hypothetical protein